MEHIVEVNEADIEEIGVELAEGDIVTGENDLPEEGDRIYRVHEENAEKIAVKLDEGDIMLIGEGDDVRDKNANEKRNAVRDKNALWHTRDLAYTIAASKCLCDVLSYKDFCYLMSFLEFFKHRIVNQEKPKLPI